MTTFKLTRNSSSSLSRSPTWKGGIDSLACLEEGVHPGRTRTERIWQQELSQEPSVESPLHERPESPHSRLKGRSNSLPRHHFGGRAESPHRRFDGQHYGREESPHFISGRTKRFDFRLLLPPVVVIIFPCIYFYARSSPQENGSRLPFPPDPDRFDYIAMVFFFSAVLISVRIAYPRLNIIYKLRTLLTQSRGCFTSLCPKSLVRLSTFGVWDKKPFGKASSVTWTIGAKGRTHKTKVAKEGVQVYSNGDVYEGEFHQGRYSGSGVYYFYMSGRYEGDWVDGKYDGYGVETWSRGSRYRGQYRQGLREGYGVYRFYTGDLYSGEWSNGQSHGCGVQTCEDGSRYVGEFKWGVKHGFGYYHFRNGDTYAGEYFADKMHGYGVYQFVNGHRYEGAWHEGKRQGLGMYTFRNGEIQAGYWHAGMLQTPSTHNAAVGANTAVNHSEVLHVVQEARRAAAKSYEVPHVDDRVNKAVAAANRAAMAARVAAVKAVQNKMPDSSLSP
ncbi:hypothetical protein KP509_07G082800 [Ceratopteris richardii]|uniref:Uncharacterized protein n=1 Tax=Ceratopteris richardii TaxID=49495 RepID=A0A8T2UBR1_CERRI|nr:hypothetical protein KP509_07G082800 [Ceratopteris richardii]KAH7433719.1 hypothetical protein KP509_07G082800 [Ceratopteris richardii]KAH7433720.1 hypothetical protein KP509_07G082800 [Ceratopteris richardii]KAH7433721.1 hypothetical protein KP509_07G082800 [Ceratopteris richardii]